jgi:prepilin-type processing-associated H-X9-DG protein
MYNQSVKALPDVPTPTGLSQALIEIRAATEPLFHCPSDPTSALDYSMNPQFAGLPKMSGKAGDVLANETGTRHSGGANVLYFDGHVDQAAQGVTIFEGEVRIPAAPPFLARRPHGP